MQKYTKLKLMELSESFAPKMSDEWDEAADLWASRGFGFGGGQLSEKIKNIGMKYLDKLLEELLSTEKIALMKEPMPSSQYFDTLKAEFIQIAFGRIEMIHSRIGGYTGQRLDSLIGKSRLDMLDDDKQIYVSRIGTKIALMQEELRLNQEELRLNIVSHSGTVINVSGDVGVVNTGPVYGSIHGHIEKMKATGNADVAELFQSLLDAIKDSQISEVQKLDQMQNVEILVEQYEIPPKERKRGLMSASMNFLSMAANLTTVWAQFGPNIMEAFKQM